PPDLVDARVDPGVVIAGRHLELRPFGAAQDPHDGARGIDRGGSLGEPLHDVRLLALEDPQVAGSGPAVDPPRAVEALLHLLLLHRAAASQHHEKRSATQQYDRRRALMCNLLLRPPSARTSPRLLAKMRHAGRRRPIQFARCWKTPSMGALEILIMPAIGSSSSRIRKTAT